jgi:hypothetical protein
MPLAACLFAGLAISTSSGCFQSLGPSMGFLSVPIPVSPYHMKQKEDRFHIKERYGKLPVLPPIPPGGPTEAIDPPSDDEVMRTLEEIDPVQGGLPLMHEIQRNNVLIHKEKTADFIDPPRVYPLVGPAQLHHARWKCTVYYTKVIRPGWPLPQHKVDNCVEVIHIDHDHLHRCGNPNENLGAMAMLPTTGDHPAGPPPGPTSPPPAAAAPPMATPAPPMPKPPVADPAEAGNM